MSDVNKKRINLTWWQRLLLLVLCLVVFLWLGIKTINNAKLYPIQVNPNGLSDIEVLAIEQALSQIGKVQFLTADLAKIHHEVDRLSWVENASVARTWNQGILVSAVPRVAIANYGSNQMLDANGVAFEPADPQAVMDAKLAYLYGRNEEAVLVMQQMQKINNWFAPINLQAKDLILTPRRTWIVVFNNGMRAVVDYEDTEQKLYNLSVQLTRNFSEDIPKIQSVDLRYKNGFAITYKK